MVIKMGKETDGFNYKLSNGILMIVTGCFYLICVKVGGIRNL